MLKFTEPCGKKDVVLAQFDPRADIELHVENTGTCPIKARFERAGTQVFARTIPPDKTKDIFRDDITAVILDCLGKDCDDDECAASYRISGTSHKRVRDACGSKAGEISINQEATIKVKIVNRGECKVQVEFAFRDGDGPIQLIDTMLVDTDSEDTLTVKEVNRVFFKCLGRNTKRCVFSYEATIK